MSCIRSAMTAAVALVSFAACIAQKPVSFYSNTFPGGPRPGNLYTADFNKDGLPDILQDTAETPVGWTVIRGSAPGNFRQPVFTDSGWGFAVTQLPLAIADFNGDGIADVAVAINGTNEVTVLFGKGDGTFPTSKSTVISYPDNIIFLAYYTATVAADFNADGKIDIVGEKFSGDGSGAVALYLFSGDGAGGFQTTPTSIFSVPAGTEVHNIVAGDFNNDGRADVAFVNTTPCGTTICSATLHVLYGAGTLGFRDTTPYTANGPFEVSAGDLNGDGVTDLFGVDSAAGRLAVFYAQAGGTFASYFRPVPPGTFGGTSAGGFIADGQTTNAPSSPQLAMADFNADWNMDLVGFEHNPVAGTDSLVFFLAAGSPGAFTTQIVPLPSHLYTTNPIAADFNRDRKPDVIVNQSDGGSSTMLVFTNSTSGGTWSNCLYPAKGIDVCSPSQTSVSPVEFTSAATSYGDIRKMELWIDGVKVGEQHHTWGTQAWFNSSVPVANGTHSVSFFSGDIDKQIQKLTYSLTVGAPVCTPPTAPGIVICHPTQGATVSRPIAVQASANVDGSFARMEVWVDNAKQYTQTSTPYLDAQIPAAPGAHKLDIFAVNTLGVTWHSVVNVTAQ